MALSYYSNVFTIPQIQTNLKTELLDCPDTFIDPFFQQPESFLPANHPVQPEFDPFAYPNCHYVPDLLPDFCNGGFFPNPAPDILPDILDSSPEILASAGCDFGGKNYIPNFCNGGLFANPAPDTSPDFLKTSPEIHAPAGCDFGGKNYVLDWLPDFLNGGFFANPAPDILPDFLGTLPEILAPAGCDSGGKKPSVSAQSIAARQRRRKISKKTQELVKLIPGGQKMNTAEMLQAAKKYVKFLQAQVGILETMGSVQESDKEVKNEEMQNLVTSTLVQEKLYSEEKCLVPKEFVKTIAKNDHIQSNMLIKKELVNFL